MPASASIDAAASAAAQLSLATLFPAEAEHFDELLAADLATIPEGPAKRAGIDWGQHVARQILALRAIDNADAVIAPASGTGPGVWQPTPPAFAAFLLPQWAFVTPFAIPSGSFARPPGPPALDSARWTADYDEVKALGTCRRVVAHTGADADRALLGRRRRHRNATGALEPHRAARERRPPHGARREGAPVCAPQHRHGRCRDLAWDAKFAYDFWRPVTAIRNADADGNPDTTADPSWSPLLVTPPFPDYVSGHSTFSGAAATVLAQFFESDQVHFTVGSDGVPGVMRSFSSFIAAAREAAASRVYGGIHFRSASDDGLAAGIAIGEWTMTHFLQAKGNRSRR